MKNYSLKKILKKIFQTSLACFGLWVVYLVFSPSIYEYRGHYRYARDKARFEQHFEENGNEIASFLANNLELKAIDELIIIGNYLEIRASVELDQEDIPTFNSFYNDWLENESLIHYSLRPKNEIVDSLKLISTIISDDTLKHYEHKYMFFDSLYLELLYSYKEWDIHMGGYTDHPALKQIILKSGFSLVEFDELLNNMRRLKLWSVSKNDGNILRAKYLGRVFEGFEYSYNATSGFPDTECQSLLFSKATIAGHFISIEEPCSGLFCGQSYYIRPPVED